ncbi:MAG: DJ-1/PfpI family protein [Planctomycetes bacterium]|nr:DJ-1/PfpI family protein [Planctomycetota bacterium]
MLISPGGGLVDRKGHGIRSEIAAGVLPRRIAAAHASGTTIAGVCTGVMAIAAAGLLRGRKAVTHHAALEELARTGVDIVRARVVDVGDIVTCGGITSSFDLALWLVERTWGRALAERTAGDLEYPRSSDIFVQTAVQ